MSNNRNMPAMPFTDSGFGQYEPEVHYGLSKREIFAMNSPSCPDWFRSSFTNSNPNFAMHNPKTGYNDKLSINGEMALIKEWRYSYADLMTEEL